MTEFTIAELVPVVEFDLWLTTTMRAVSAASQFARDAYPWLVLATRDDITPDELDDPGPRFSQLDMMVASKFMAMVHKWFSKTLKTVPGAHVADIYHKINALEEMGKRTGKLATGRNMLRLICREYARNGTIERKYCMSMLMKIEIHGKNQNKRVLQLFQQKWSDTYRRLQTEPIGEHLIELRDHYARQMRKVTDLGHAMATYDAMCNAPGQQQTYRWLYDQVEKFLEKEN
mgnify:CR=1 FL=1